MQLGPVLTEKVFRDEAIVKSLVELQIKCAKKSDSFCDFFFFSFVFELSLIVL